jgi:putative hydrolase of the HAD superfamily
LEKSKPITTLFLDIGGVLLTNGWDRQARKTAAETFSLDYDEMNERHHLTFATYEVGKLTLEEYLSLVVFYEKRKFTMDDFRNFMFDCSKPYPDMIKLVCNLKKQFNLKIAVVSNEGRELTEFRIARYKLDSFIDFFISSCFVHFRKPDADMYRIALDIAQVSAGNVLYIEDRLMFIQIAASLGIRGIQHRDYQSTASELALMGFSLAEDKCVC